MTPQSSIKSVLDTFTHSSDFNELSKLLRELRRVHGDETPKVLFSVVENWSHETIECACAHLMEMGEAEEGALLISVLTADHKHALQTSDLRLQTALLGEYRHQQWVDTLVAHWPELVVLCLDNAIAIFEKQIGVEGELLKVIPTLSEGARITCIQEKVLCSYMELMSSEHYFRYMQSNQQHNRQPCEILVAPYQHKMLTQEIEGYAQNAPLRRIKL